MKASIAVDTSPFLGKQVHIASSVVMDHHGQPHAVEAGQLVASTDAWQLLLRDLR